MCGIFFYLSLIDKYSHKHIEKCCNKIQHRGPDLTKIVHIDRFHKATIGFHRLAILDLSENGDQPFIKTDANTTIYCIINGEIYNYKELIKKYNLLVSSDSDCEVIPHIFKQYGIRQLMTDLIGEYSFVIYEINHYDNKIKLYAGRDRYGVRPLFYSNDENGFGFCSEIKGLTRVSKNIKPFPPGNYFKSEITSTEVVYKFTKYYHYNQIENLSLSYDDILFNIREKLTTSVIDRFQSNRPIGCLLSGGIDSSLVAAIMSEHLKKNNGEKLKTFSIGMKGSVDLHYAKIVSEHIQSDHTEVIFTPEEGLSYIPEVIKTIESYDITTIRASIPQYLISKYIRENTDIKVVLGGDFSDEVHGSYIYFHNAPNSEEFHSDCVRLLEEIHLYDVLRADRTIARHGLECRVPFSDHRYIDYYLTIDKKLRMPRESRILNIQKKIEKPLLREAFYYTDLLPKSILTRIKDGFSDGCSDLKKSWYQYIQEYVNEIVPDDYDASRFNINRPKTKEAYYYRHIFEGFYGEENSELIPHFWLPKWSGNTSEPSGRVLTGFSQEKSD